MNRTHIIKLRVTPAEKAAAEAVASARGETLSEMVRAYLARVTARSGVVKASDWRHTGERK